LPCRRADERGDDLVLSHFASAADAMSATSVSSRLSASATSRLGSFLGATFREPQWVSPSPSQLALTLLEIKWCCTQGIVIREDSLPPTRQFSVRIAPDAAEWLAARAKADRRSIAFIITELVREEIAREAKAKKPKAAKGRATA
jgi:hypothetical protein